MNVAHHAILKYVEVVLVGVGDVCGGFRELRMQRQEPSTILATLRVREQRR
jgi:hypothetical protein